MVDLKIVITRKNNQEMAFVRLEDDTASLEVVVFPRVFEKTRSFWTKDKVVIAEGRVDFRDEKLSVLIESASTAEELIAQESRAQKIEPSADLEIQIPARTSSAKLVKLNQFLKENPGDDQVVLVFVDNSNQEKRMPLPFGINYRPKLAQEIKKIIA